MIVVFYDGKCGLCSKEISHYQRSAPEGVFRWVDITESADELRVLGISLADGLKLLHAADSTGELHVGVDAFLLIWRQMPRWRLLAGLVGLPVIRQLANRVYRVFAQWRFKRLPHCQLALTAKHSKTLK